MLSDDHYLEQIQRASRISMICIANFRFVAANSDALHNFLRAEGELRELLLNGEHSESMYVATTRAIGSSQSPSHTHSQLQLTIDKLGELARSDDGQATKVSVKQTNYPTAHVISWFEPHRGPGIIYVTPSGFHQRTQSRPTFVVSEEQDPVGYRYFADYFENLWTWDGSVIIELSDNEDY